MKELGLQAAARIVASSEPLRALTQMAQNFPNLAAALSRVAVPKQLRAELKKLHRVLQGGLHLLLLMMSLGFSDCFIVLLGATLTIRVEHLIGHRWLAKV